MAKELLVGVGMDWGGVEYFVDRGYQRGKSIRAAPYDWRLAADQLYVRGYYDKVKSLIEEMYKSNGGRKVTLVAHSMGGPVTLFFLNNVVTQQWKNTYIYAFVPIAGAWSGGNKILLAQMSGMKPPELSPAVQKPSVRGNAVLVPTPKRSYTANDYEALFRDMGYPIGFKMYTGVSVINAGFTAPNVPVYCFYGTDVQTAESFVYDQGFPDSQPTRIVYGNSGADPGFWERGRIPDLDVDAISLSDLIAYLKADQDKLIDPDSTEIIPALQTFFREGEYIHIASNTGIVPTAVMKKLFSEYNIEIITQFTIHFELCQAVALSQVDTNMAPEGSPSSDLGPLLFFPALVSVERPSSATVPNNSFGWSMIVKSPDQFFTTRCLHVLLRLSLLYLQSGPHPYTLI
eukprot:Em0049g25a